MKYSHNNLRFHSHKITFPAILKMVISAATQRSPTDEESRSKSDCAPISFEFDENAALVEGK